jgi:glutamate 5-kinase
MVITKGGVNSPLAKLESGARCTWFVPSGTPRTARKEWIAGSLKPHGAIIIDAGAVGALKQGKSLLPVGVAGLEGTFERGDAVVVRDFDGFELAHGLTAYSSQDITRIKGYKTSEIETILGYRGRDEIIHRDDLAII